MSKHQFVTVKDKRGALDAVLAGFARRGVKVLDYWREDGQIRFKLSAPKAVAA